MATKTGPIYLAPTGTTGNPTSAAVQVPPEVDTIGINFVVEAVGATPTITLKAQGSIDGTNWFDLPYVDATTDTLSQAAKTITAVSAIPIWFDSGAADNRKIVAVRSVASANTNVTFRVELYLWDELAD
ncbi:MAG TPA: hypothetical protein VIY48_14375 [Candidatus Paceibacterota bacterium]